MGPPGTDLRADAHVARHLARPDAGRLSCRRLEHQHHHAADAVLPAGCRILSALCEGHRYWHVDRDDAAVFDVVPADLDGIPADLLCDRLPTRVRGKLYVPTNLKEADARLREAGHFLPWQAL